MRLVALVWAAVVTMLLGIAVWRVEPVVLGGAMLVLAVGLLERRQRAELRRRWGLDRS